MDDELRNIEQTLQSMPLRKVPASLDGKVVRPGGSRARRRVLIGGMAAAAAIVAVLLLALSPWAPCFTAGPKICWLKCGHTTCLRLSKVFVRAFCA